jgi:hypothetical protein
LSPSSTTRRRETEVSLRIDAIPAAAYDAVADMRAMAKLSPECFAVWRFGDRYVGWNRRKAIIWFTTCRIVVSEPGREFAFDVTSFGLRVARWGYRFTPSGDGVDVTEYWQDRRGRIMDAVGYVISGGPPGERATMNEGGMRTTLARLKDRLETVSS